MASLRELSHVILLFLLCFPVVLTLPIQESTGENVTHTDLHLTRELSKRVPGQSMEDPIDATFDISGWEDIAEEDCYAMLCLMNGRRVFNRTATVAERGVNNIASGTSLRPFRGDPSYRSVARIDATTVSAEEFPWESMWHTGRPAYVFPASMQQQDNQGRTVGAAYATQGINFKSWFKITFTGAPLRKYCTALFKDPPDFEMCSRKPKQVLFQKTQVDISKFAYQVDKSKQPYQFRPATPGFFLDSLTKRDAGPETNATAAEEEEADHL